MWEMWADFSQGMIYANSASGIICVIRIKLINVLEVVDYGKLLFVSTVLLRRYPWSMYEYAIACSSQP